MSHPVLRLTPLRAALKAGAAQTLPCLVSLTADEAALSAPTRQPLNLALVLDVSPSMDSVAFSASAASRPIEQAKEAARLLISRLAPTDRVALVIYATTATVLMPSSPIAECRDQAMHLLASVRTREQSTALHAGWLHGAQAIAGHVAPSVQSRILLLSDGVANEGECHSEALGAHANRLLQEAGISTSTYGVGNHFNEDLMTTMGQSGGGQAFYAAEASELAAYFDTELNLMAHCVARQIEVSVTALFEGGSLSWLTGRPNAQGQVHLSDLVSGANSWALATIQVPDTIEGSPLPLRAHARWVDAQGVQHESTVEIQIALGEAEAAEDTLVAERVKEAEAARLQREARHQAARGDFAAAQMSVQAMASMAGSNAYVASVANNLSALLARGDNQVFQKEAAYGAYSMSTRSVSNDEDFTSLKADRLGLRKSVQGRSATSSENKQP